MTKHWHMNAERDLDLQLLRELSMALQRVAEQERSGVRDGEGDWIDRNPFSTIPDGIRQVCERLWPDGFEYAPLAKDNRRPWPQAA